MRYILSALSGIEEIRFSEMETIQSFNASIQNAESMKFGIRQLTTSLENKFIIAVR